jgi:hypothetical protein
MLIAAAAAAARGGGGGGGIGDALSLSGLSHSFSAADWAVLSERVRFVVEEQDGDGEGADEVATRAAGAGAAAALPRLSPSSFVLDPSVAADDDGVLQALLTANPRLSQDLLGWYEGAAVMREGAGSSSGGAAAAAAAAAEVLPRACPWERIVPLLVQDCSLLQQQRGLEERAGAGSSSSSSSSSSVTLFMTPNRKGRRQLREMLGMRERQQIQNIASPVRTRRKLGAAAVEAGETMDDDDDEGSAGGAGRMPASQSSAAASWPSVAPLPPRMRAILDRLLCAFLSLEQPSLVAPPALHVEVPPSLAASAASGLRRKTARATEAAPDANGAGGGSSGSGSVPAPDSSAAAAAAAGGGSSWRPRKRAVEAPDVGLRDDGEGEGEGAAAAAAAAATTAPSPRSTRRRTSRAASQDTSSLREDDGEGDGDEAEHASSPAEEEEGDAADEEEGNEVDDDEDFLVSSQVSARSASRDGSAGPLGAPVLATVVVAPSAVAAAAAASSTSRGPTSSSPSLPPEWCTAEVFNPGSFVTHHVPAALALLAACSEEERGGSGSSSGGGGAARPIGRSRASLLLRAFLADLMRSRGFDVDGGEGHSAGSAPPSSSVRGSRPQRDSVSAYFGRVARSLKAGKGKGKAKGKGATAAEEGAADDEGLAGAVFSSSPSPVSLGESLRSLLLSALVLLEHEALAARASAGPATAPPPPALSLPRAAPHLVAELGRLIRCLPLYLSFTGLPGDGLPFLLSRPRGVGAFPYLLQRLIADPYYPLLPELVFRAYEAVEVEPPRELFEWGVPLLEEEFRREEQEEEEERERERAREARRQKPAARKAGKGKKAAAAAAAPPPPSAPVSSRLQRLLAGPTPTAAAAGASEAAATGTAAAASTAAGSRAPPPLSILPSSLDDEDSRMSLAPLVRNGARGGGVGGGGGAGASSGPLAPPSQTSSSAPSSSSLPAPPPVPAAVSGPFSGISARFGAPSLAAGAVRGTGAGTVASGLVASGSSSLQQQQQQRGGGGRGGLAGTVPLGAPPVLRLPGDLAAASRGPAASAGAASTLGAGRRVGAGLALPPPSLGRQFEVVSVNVARKSIIGGTTTAQQQGGRPGAPQNPLRGRG